MANSLGLSPEGRALISSSWFRADEMSSCREDQLRSTARDLSWLLLAMLLRALLIPLPNMDKIVECAYVFPTAHRRR